MAAWAHEGYGQGGGGEHQKFGEQAAATLAGDPWRAVEDLVGRSEQYTRTRVRGRVTDDVNEEIRNAAKIEPTGNFPATEFWVWSPSRNQYVLRAFGPI